MSGEGVKPMTEDRTWKIWVCPNCWEHLSGPEDENHRVTEDGDMLCLEDNLSVVPLRIEVSRYLAVPA